MLRSLAFITLALIIAHSSHAQTLDDALRLATDPLPSGARSLAMGGGLISAAQGISALEANPAAIAPMETREFVLDFFDDAHKSQAIYLTQPQSTSQSQFSLNSLGLAGPWAVTRGHLAFGISYDRVREYNSTYAF